MNPKTSPERASHPLGELLRSWRARRGRSQLELSLDTGISQRHISFIESGRSSPSRGLLLGIARALDIPLRDRNALLLSAGYAPIYPEPAWDAAEMRVIHRALARMLARHDPFPAIVMDRHWNVLMHNATAPRFFGKFFDLAARAGQRNLLHLIFDPAAMRPFVANWNQVARSLFERIGREAVGGVVDDGMRDLIAQLKAYPDVPGDLESGTAPASFAGHSHRLRARRTGAELLLDGVDRRNAAGRGGAGVARRVHVSGRRRDRGVASEDVCIHAARRVARTRICGRDFGDGRDLDALPGGRRAAERASLPAPRSASPARFLENGVKRGKSNPEDPA